MEGRAAALAGPGRPFEGTGRLPLPCDCLLPSVLQRRTTDLLQVTAAWGAGPREATPPLGVPGAATVGHSCTSAEAGAGRPAGWVGGAARLYKSPVIADQRLRQRGGWNSKADQAASLLSARRRAQDVHLHTRLQLLLTENRISSSDPCFGPIFDQSHHEAHDRHPWEWVRKRRQSLPPAELFEIGQIQRVTNKHIPPVTTIWHITSLIRDDTIPLRFAE
ncbi:uncharacterized protein LOC135302313 [Passer domesticus]|uniref:uncharacterized protein LOC135302313 n=1 Tax=Passer domesticus TaxID=48849 RepID=UPI0030FEA306